MDDTFKEKIEKHFLNRLTKLHLPYKIRLTRLNLLLLPSTNPEEQQFWIASSDGSATYTDDQGDPITVKYNEGDIITYLNGLWRKLPTSVESVNGKYGNVQINEGSIFKKDVSTFPYRKYIALGDGLNVTDNGTDTLTITTAKVGGYTGTIGDNVSKTFTINHNLNTLNVIVQFRDVTTNEQVIMDNKIVDANNIQVDVSEPIPKDSVKVYIIGMQ